MRAYKVDRSKSSEKINKELEEMYKETNIKCSLCDRFLMQVDIEIHHKICCICYFKELGKPYNVD